MAPWSSNIDRFGKRDTATHESLAREYGVDRGQQVSRGRYLVNVATAAQTERLSYDIRRGLLAHEEKSCVGGEPGDVFSDLESLHLRQVDIEQNQIRPHFFGLLNGLQPIRRLDGLELRPSLKRRTNETAERRMVLDDENPQPHMWFLRATSMSRFIVSHHTRAARVRARTYASDMESEQTHDDCEWLDEEDGEENVLRHWRDGYRRRCAPPVTQNESRDVRGKDNPGAENRRSDGGNKRGAGLVGILAL